AALDPYLVARLDQLLDGFGCGGDPGFARQGFARDAYLHGGLPVSIRQSCCMALPCRLEGGGGTWPGSAAGVQRLAKIVEDVVDVLDADGQADHVFADTGTGEFVGAELAMRGRGRVAGQG